MSTTIRPEISENNKYWIEKHRYYELKHFCLQYPFWKKAHATFDIICKKSPDLAAYIRSSGYGYSNPTESNAIEKLFYSSRIDMIDRVAKETDEGLAPYIIVGVTEGLSYEKLKARLEIPCSKDTYYDRYRRFFWLLNKERA